MREELNFGVTPTSTEEPMSYEKSTHIEDGKVGEVSSVVEVFEIPLSESVRQSLSEHALPSRLWLGMHRHKEFPPGYRHAWGNAWVSTTQDGGNAYPVARLRFRISMPEPNGPNISDGTCNNCSSQSGDCKFFGAVFGDFRSDWFAEASDPSYGTWSVSGSW